MFIILALIAICCASLVIVLKRISHRVLSMAFCSFAIAGLYFLLRAEFLGIIQIMVYVGGLTVLFVFAVMMTDHRTTTFVPERSKVFKFVSFIGVGSLLSIMLIGILGMDLPAGTEPFIGTAEAIGLELYGNYVIAFLGVGILLLAALIGAIVIARKEADEQ
nr:NADH-quinone oxidoreductase subunit J [Texcoconibacillus texcoconensis]